MRAAIVLSLMLVVPTAASAGWERADTAGFVQYVETWRPGVYSVITGELAEVWDNGTMVAEFLYGDMSGTFVSPAGCYAGARLNGEVVNAVDICWRPGNIIPPPGSEELNTQIERLRFTPSGTGYAAVLLDPPIIQLLTASPREAGDPPWAPLSVSSDYFPTHVMGVTDTEGGVPHAIFHVRGRPEQFLWYREDQQQAAISIPPSLTTNPPRTVDLITADGPNPIALFGNADGLFRGQLTPSAEPITPFSRVAMPDAGTVSINAVDVNTGSGSRHGHGYGLAVGTSADGGSVILQAVPADSAANAGTQWRLHPTLNNDVPVLQGTEPIDVQCVASAFCVIGLYRPSGTAQGNHILYRNDASPVVGMDAGVFPLPLSLDEGGSSVVVEFFATDSDDDPVRVSMDDSSVQGPLAVTSVEPVPDKLTVRMEPHGEVCADVNAQLRVYASDGLHDTESTVPVLVRNTQGPNAPSVTPTEPSTLAGGEPVIFVASPGPGASMCLPTGYQWASENASQPALITDASGTATFEPPDILCQPTPRQYTYTVRALDQGNLPSTPTSLTVNVLPWGPPLAPFEDGAVRPLVSGPDAGVEVGPGPEALHSCTGTPGLPTVETVWRLSAPRAGFTVKDEAGTVVAWDSTVVSPRLRVEAAECTEASLSLTARNRIAVAGGTQEGPEATVQVVATPPVEDFADVQLNLSAASTDDGQVDVNLGTSLRCPDAYPLPLQAQVSVTGADGGTVAEARMNVPNTWSPSLLEVCSAAEYVIAGQLFTGNTAGNKAETRVTVPERKAALGTLEGGPLVARCGEGATGTLTQTIPPDACRAVDLSWEQVDGPELVERTLSGESVTVATRRDVGLEELVGQTLRLRVTANASESNSATTVYDVPITTEPFVDVRHETESPTGSEKGLVGVVVRLRNTSECRVGNLRHVERLDGLEWVPGSVKVDGQPVVEQAVEGGFAVDGVTLEASATGTLTYVARPRLLSSPRYGGEVFLNSVLVSGSVPPAPTSGCGCSGGGSGAAVFGLAALARLLRRRRHGAPGAPR